VVRIEQLQLERVRITAANRLNNEFLARARFKVWEQAAGELMASLESYIHGLPHEKISVHEKYPADWWQAFKERWFPACLLRRFPVHYKRIDIEERKFGAVCPHLHDDPQDKHLTWLVEQRDARCLKY
jgi:hypothetical protein